MKNRLSFEISPRTIGRFAAGVVLATSLLAIAGAHPYTAAADGTNSAPQSLWAPPTPVIQSVAIASPTSLQVSWDDDVNLDPWVSRAGLNMFYLVNVYQGGARVNQIESATTPVVVTGLQENVRYCIGVQGAANDPGGVGTSAESALSCATPAGLSSLSFSPRSAHVTDVLVQSSSAPPPQTNVFKSGPSIPCHVATEVDPCG